MILFKLIDLKLERYSEYFSIAFTFVLFQNRTSIAKVSNPGATYTDIYFQLLIELALTLQKKYIKN